MNQDIALTVHDKNGVHILAIQGNMTTTTGGILEKAYHQKDVSKAKKLILAFDKESRIDSGGIAILIGILVNGRDKGQRIRLVHPAEHYRKILTMVGFKKYTQIFASEESALKGFS